MTIKQPKSWRDQIKVHPAADILPEMTADEKKVLGEDIKMQFSAPFPGSRRKTWLRDFDIYRLDLSDLLPLTSPLLTGKVARWRVIRCSIAR